MIAVIFTISIYPAHQVLAMIPEYDDGYIYYVSQDDTHTDDTLLFDIHTIPEFGSITPDSSYANIVPMANPALVYQVLEGLLISMGLNAQNQQTEWPNIANPLEMTIQNMQRLIQWSEINANHHPTHYYLMDIAERAQGRNAYIDTNSGRLMLWDEENQRHFDPRTNQTFVGDLTFAGEVQVANVAMSELENISLDFRQIWGHLIEAEGWETRDYLGQMGIFPPGHNWIPQELHPPHRIGPIPMFSKQQLGMNPYNTSSFEEMTQAIIQNNLDQLMPVSVTIGTLTITSMAGFVRRGVFIPYINNPDDWTHIWLINAGSLQRTHSRAVVSSHLADHPIQQNDPMPIPLPLNPLNIMDNLPGVMASIREAAGTRVDTETGQVVSIETGQPVSDEVAIIIPNNLGQIPGAGAAPGIGSIIFPITIVQAPPITQPQPTPVPTPAPSPGYGAQIGTIIGILTSTLNYVRAMPTTISNTLVGDMQFDFDRRIQLHTFFPFSIPWDLRDAIASMANASGVNAAQGNLDNLPFEAFSHDGFEFLDFGYQTISPYSLIPDAYVFRIDFPDPFNYRWELNLLDFYEYIQVIRWGTGITFLFALMLLTRTVITW